MKKKTFKFGNASTDFYFAGGISHLKEIADVKNMVVLTDENLFNLYQKKLKSYKTIVLAPGEENKTQSTIDSVIQQLIDLEADRKTTLVGIGGGVITDITGFVASIYMRGIRFGFIPTTLLALVDASIGGKNGIDVGIYKNIIGIIRQPAFILHDLSFLNSLPEKEWQNGFAEIIKHACIKDLAMFKQLEQHSLSYYRKNKKEACLLIHRNAKLKIKVVQADEFEQGERKLLNFGHTLGHALENQYKLSHGHAVAIGSAYAAMVSKQLTGFRQTDRLVKVLEQYGLPAFMAFDKLKTLAALKMDKKRERKSMNYIVLERIGKGVMKSIPLGELETILTSL
jgi:3-dehydroquinate synthase